MSLLPYKPTYTLAEVLDQFDSVARAFEERPSMEAVHDVNIASMRWLDVLYTMKDKDGYLFLDHIEQYSLDITRCLNGMKDLRAPVDKEIHIFERDNHQFKKQDTPTRIVELKRMRSYIDSTMGLMGVRRELVSKLKINS